MLGFAGIQAAVVFGEHQALAMIQRALTPRGLKLERDHELTLTIASVVPEGTS